MNQAQNIITTLKGWTS